MELMKINMNNYQQEKKWVVNGSNLAEIQKILIIFANKKNRLIVILTILVLDIARMVIQKMINVIMF